MVHAKASQIRQKIAEKLRGKLICLKIDIAKRLGRSLLGQCCGKLISIPISTIRLLGGNVQFIKNGKKISLP